MPLLMAVILAILHVVAWQSECTLFQSTDYKIGCKGAANIMTTDISNPLHLSFHRLTYHKRQPSFLHDKWFWWGCHLWIRWGKSATPKSMQEWWWQWLEFLWKKGGISIAEVSYECTSCARRLQFIQERILNHTVTILKYETILCHSKMQTLYHIDLTV
jgi:hypothetical protein